MRRPTVSVAMATYNGERFLEEQLASIAQQTAPVHELVVCDDGSSDGTLRILDEFAGRCPFPVRVHRNEARLGFADNFLTAASLCAGDAIAFADQDDVWTAEKLEACVGELADGVVLAVHTCELVDEDLRPLGRVFPRIKRRVIAEPLESDVWFPMPGMAMVFAAGLMGIADWRRRPRSHFEVGAPIYHDEWIHVLAQVCGKIAFLPEKLALYRQHAVNVTGAPARALVQRPREALTVGAGYYASRAAQAGEWSELFARLAREEDDHVRRTRFEGGAGLFADLARRLRLRLSVYETAERIPRLRALAHVFAVGGYGSRARGGFGVRGLVRDVVMIALGRR